MLLKLQKCHNLLDYHVFATAGFFVCLSCQRWLAVNDQADSDRRVLEAQIQTLKAQVHQMAEKLSAKEEHCKRIVL